MRLVHRQRENMVSPVDFSAAAAAGNLAIGAGLGAVLGMILSAAPKR